MKKFVLPTLFAALFVFSSGCSTTPRMVTYDYVVFRNPSDGDLIKMGNQGWRVVGFASDETKNEGQGVGAGHTTIIMERPRQ